MNLRQCLFGTLITVVGKQLLLIVFEVRLCSKLLKYLWRKLQRNHLKIVAMQALS